MTMTRQFLVLMFVSKISVCTGDYPCICSHAVDTPLYSQPDSTSTIIGHMYESDCKPQYTKQKDHSLNWDAVMYKKQVGYLQRVDASSLETCQGSISPFDKVTTVRLPLTSSTSVTTSTSASQTLSSTTPTKITSSIRIPTKSITTSTTPKSTTTNSNTTSITTVSTTKLSTTTGAMPTPSTSTISKTTKSKTISTTLTQSLTKSTTEQVTHPPLPHVTNTTQITYKCPNNVVSAAIYNGGHTRVYGSICYEMIPHHLYHWTYAENNCRNKGGHLAYIRNMTEENHVMRFLYDLGHKHAVWIGLTDLNHENYFRWTSGDPVTFTKWLPGHTSNFVNHHIEDCVVLVPYIKPGVLGSYGVWDDIDCSVPHSWICQYDAVPTQQWIATTKNWITSIFGRPTTGHHHNIHFTTKNPVIGPLGPVLDLIG